MRRHVTPLLLAAVLAAMPRAGAAQEADARALLGQAREALGGDAALNAVTAFVIEGSLARAIMPGRMVSNNFSFECALPDTFVRITHAGSNGGPLPPFSTTDFAGFNANALIRDHRVTGNPPMPTFIPDPRVKTAADAAAARAALVTAYKREFIKLVVPLFAQSLSAYPLSFERVSLEADGAVITFTTPDSVRWELSFDPKSHLPVKLSWMESPPMVVSTSSMITVGGNGGVASSTSQPNMPLAPGAPARWELTMSDYRVADGINWPRRMTTTVGGAKTEEWQFSKIRINPKIDDKDFVPRDRHDD